jgi:hypothetical protein
MVYNLRWLVEGHLAGSSKPSNAEEVDFLVDAWGIRAAISLEPTSEAVSDAFRNRGVPRLLFFVDDEDPNWEPAEHELELPLAFVRVCVEKLHRAERCWGAQRRAPQDCESRFRDLDARSPR